MKIAPCGSSFSQTVALSRNGCSGIESGVAGRGRGSAVPDQRFGLNLLRGVRIASVGDALAIFGKRVGITDGFSCGIKRHSKIFGYQSL
jgi:hypothetical protein